MTLLPLKLALTPLLIALVMRITRVHGARLGGMLVGLPITSGPLSVFLTAERGSSFAAHAAAGALEGTIAVVAFSTAYGHAARRSSWAWALVAGTTAFVVTIATLHYRPLPLWFVTTLALGVSTIIVFRGRVPCGAVDGPRASAPRSGEGRATILRMLVGTGIVGAVSFAAHLLGPAWSGILSALPILTSVLAVATHRRDGGAIAARLVDGVTKGCVGTMAFFVIVASFVAAGPAPLVYVVALAITILLNGRIGFIRQPVLQRG
jgi:hypothetical protein